MTNEEREDLNTFRHDLIKRARWWQWKAETLEKENEQLKAENAAMCGEQGGVVYPQDIEGICVAWGAQSKEGTC